MVGSSPATANINVTSGDLTVNKNITATAGSADDATITLAAANKIIVDNSTVRAEVGDSEGSVAGEALVSLAAPGGITVRNGSSIRAVGGSANFYGSGNGGDATTVLATGANLLITDSSVRAEGGNSGGGGGVPGVGTTALFGSTMTIGGGSGVTGVYGDDVSLVGNMINAVGGTSSGATTTVEADGTLNVLAAIDLNVQGGSGSGNYSVLKGFDDAVVIAGGNVNVTGGNGAGTSAGILGSPDVNLVVGGSVNLQAGNGSGASATIAAGSIETITLDFPLRTSGGFSVNGQEGVVFDSATNTGFLVDGSPAVLGTNFFVAYFGESPTPPSPPPAVINQIVVANELNTDVIQPDQLSGAEAGEGVPDEKKKDLPVCR